MPEEPPSEFSADHQDADESHPVGDLSGQGLLGVTFEIETSNMFSVSNLLLFFRAQNLRLNLTADELLHGASEALPMRALKIAVCVLSFGLLVAPAQAASINFENLLTGSGGTLTYAGGATPLVGDDIPFDTVTVSGAPLNNGVYACVNCLLDFTTGNNVNLGLNPLEAWQGGGSFTLTGSITGVVGQTTLLSGSWSSNGINQIGYVGVFGPGGFTGGGGGTDQKDAELLAFFGLTNPFIYTNTNFTAQTCLNPGQSSAFTCDVDEADLSNRDLIGDIPVPEPASLLLLGSGLVGLAHRARRRNRR